jgi:saccharopine dehydrogenase-like NADP-dependent oxidoreductase
MERKLAFFTERITEYESWCGGLPSPEFCDNPIGYKFSWSPISALKALNNNSKFIDQGAVKEVPNENLMYSA